METVLITGANRGIGLELTQRYLARGDRVIATCREPGSADDLVRLDDGRLKVCELDVRDPDALQMLASDTADPIDVLINNAGIMPAQQSIDAMAYDDWLTAFDVHAIAPFRAIVAFKDHLARAERPRAIVISSRMGAMHRLSPGAYAYRSSKAAANKVAQLLAIDLQRDGIIVCPMHPGWVQTDMGGSAADITVAESAKGLVTVIDGLTPEASGRFWMWDGGELEW